MQYWSHWNHSSNHYSNRHFIFLLFALLQLSFLFIHNHHHSYSNCYSCHEGHHVHRAIISRRCSCSSPLTWRQVLPARVERNWRHFSRVTFQLRDLLHWAHVPHPHSVVVRACEEEGGGWSAAAEYKQKYGYNEILWQFRSETFHVISQSELQSSSYLHNHEQHFTSNAIIWIFKCDWMQRNKQIHKSQM